MPDTMSAYDILELPLRLQVDPSLLQKHFYDKSKMLHPDRFATRPSEAFKALRWATRLNQAYQTLRDPIERSNAWLAQHGVAKEAQKAVPRDLAEEYFELQEILDGAPDSSVGRDFQKKLEAKLDSDLKRWSKIADEIDQSNSSATSLTKLRDYLNEQRYLESMLDNLKRKLGV